MASASSRKPPKPFWKQPAYANFRYNMTENATALKEHVLSEKEEPEQANREPYSCVSRFSFTIGDSEALIGLARDKRFRDYDMTHHALKALSTISSLGQKHAELLIPLWNDDDEGLQDTLVGFFAKLGRPAAKPLSKFILDDSRDSSARVSASEALKGIAVNDPESRTLAIETISQVLQTRYQLPPPDNGLLVSFLVDLRATEALPVIRRAYEADVVDEDMVGDLGTVLIDLGVPIEKSDPLVRWCSHCQDPVAVCQRRIRQQRVKLYTDSVAEARAKLTPPEGGEISQADATAALVVALRAMNCRSEYGCVGSGENDTPTSLVVESLIALRRFSDAQAIVDIEVARLGEYSLYPDDEYRTADEYRIALLAKATLLEATGDINEAIQFVNRVLTSKPNHPLALAKLESLQRASAAAAAGAAPAAPTTSSGPTTAATDTTAAVTTTTPAAGPSTEPPVRWKYSKLASAEWSNHHLGPKPGHHGNSDEDPLYRRIAARVAPDPAYPGDYQLVYTSACTVATRKRGIFKSQGSAPRSISIDTCAALDVYGDTIAIGSTEDYSVRMWRMDENEASCTAIFGGETGHTGSITALRIDPQGRWVISGSDDRTARVWSLATRQLERVLWGHVRTIHDLWFEPASAQVWTASDELIRQYDVASGVLVKVFSFSHGTKWNVHYLVMAHCVAANETLVVGGANTYIKVWSRQTGEILHTLAMAKLEIPISADIGTNHAVFACVNGVVHLVNLHTGKADLVINNIHQPKYIRHVRLIEDFPEKQTVLDGLRNPLHAYQVITVCDDQTAVLTQVTARRSGQTLGKCASCSRPETKIREFKVCGKCKKPRYCSVDCQRAAWPSHKTECP